MALQQFDFGTVPKKQWVEGDPIYKKLEGNSQVGALLLTDSMSSITGSLLTFMSVSGYLHITQIPALPGLPSKLETYTRNMTHLSHTFLSLVGECLSLPPTTFHRFLGGMDRFKLVKYPAISPTAGASSSFGVGPHKDSTGLFTFLSQDSIGGLQVLLKSGKWVDAPPIPSSFVVNIQQGFEAITGGLCSATTHRVLVRACVLSPLAELSCLMHNQCHVDEKYVLVLILKCRHQNTRRGTAFHSSLASIWILHWKT